MQSLSYGIVSMEDKIDQILKNQEVIIQYLQAIYAKVSDTFTENYAANLLAQITEMMLGHNTVRQ